MPPSAPDRPTLATAGFASASDVYERVRPAYPDSLLAELARAWGLSPGARALDLAAGTGKLTRQLRAAGAECIAVEPSAAMRAECRRVSPGVSVVGGSAEAIPLADDAVDLLTVAQAFHWFDPARSLHEMARVVRPGGAVVVVWNERDLSVPWAAELDALLRRVADPPHPPVHVFSPTLSDSRHFGPSTHWHGGHEVAMTPDEVVDLVASRSYVRVLGETERAAVLGEVRRWVEPLPRPLRMPYVTNAYCATALPGPCACPEEV